MKGQKLENIIHDHIKMKRSLSNTASFPRNWLHSKQTGLNQFFPHRLDKRAAEEPISDPKNTTDQKVFSFHLKKDECVEVKNNQIFYKTGSSVKMGQRIYYFMWSFL